LGASLLAVVDKSMAWNALIDVVINWQRQITTDASALRTSGVLPPLALLSPREQRVFDCLGQGLLNREVASELGLSVGTVESYRKAICSKLGVSGSELVRLAVLRRCLPSPGPFQAAD
jgi:DNA-binding NarL/FixJ family response regulator